MATKRVTLADFEAAAKEYEEAAMESHTLYTQLYRVQGTVPDVLAVACRKASVRERIAERRMDFIALNSGITRVGRGGEVA